MSNEPTAAQVTEIIEGIENHREQEHILFWSKIDPLFHTLVKEIIDDRKSARDLQEQADGNLASFDAEPDF